MNKTRRVINLCLSHVNGTRCTNTRPFGNLFCSKHNNVCPTCRRAYIVDNGLYCEYCSMQMVFASIES